MTILKQQLKILRFISKNHPVMASVLYSRYGYDEVTGLLRGGYIICPEDPRRQDDEGYVIGAFLPLCFHLLTKARLRLNLMNGSIFSMLFL